MVPKGSKNAPQNANWADFLQLWKLGTPQKAPQKRSYCDQTETQLKHGSQAPGTWMPKASGIQVWVPFHVFLL